MIILHADYFIGPFTGFDSKLRNISSCKIRVSQKLTKITAKTVKALFAKVRNVFARKNEKVVVAFPAEEEVVLQAVA